MGPFCASMHWSSIVPGANSLIAMMKTLRERGNAALADQLEALATKQGEAQMRGRIVRGAQDSSKEDKNVKHQNSLAEKELQVIKQCDEIQLKSQLISCPSSQEEEKSEVLAKHQQSELTSKSEEEDLADESEKNSEYESNSLYSWVSEDDWQSDWEEFLPEEDDDQQLLQQQQPLPKEAVLPPKDPWSCFHARLDTFFGNWVSPSPSELAESGFFLVGPRDLVECFSCRTRQSCWRAAEDPWVRHAQRAPACAYVRQKRGEEFVRRCCHGQSQQQQQPLGRSSWAVADALSMMHKRASRNSKWFK